MPIVRLLLLISCASALRLPSRAHHGHPRLRTSGGGSVCRGGPMICKSTDEEWARRWPNKTPEEIANMKKWCGRP